MKAALGLFLILVPAAVATACSASHDDAAGEGSSSEDFPGAVNLQLLLPSGENIEVVSWAISGPNGGPTVVKSGTADSQGLHVSFLVGGIPAGDGYSITLSGTATDGSVTCTGSSAFNVATRQTTPVTVELGCSVATSGSHVTLINGSAFNCAATSGIAASPSETTVGHTVMLQASAAGPNPSALTYAWSAPSGTFGQPSASGTTFECTTPGPVTVTLVVGDGPVPSGQSCATTIDTATAIITCDATVPNDGGVDAGTGPPPPVPAVPPLGTAALAAAMAAAGALAARRRRGADPAR